MQPFKQISIDFKSMIPFTKHPYLLTILDKCSWFPFGNPVSDTSAQTVIRCFPDLFAVFSVPGYVHSDCGIAFMATKLKELLLSKGLATSRTTLYNPTGNSRKT